MPDFRNIEIDIDVHKLIEGHRTSFDETPNDILRGLLNLGACTNRRAPTDEESVRSVVVRALQPEGYDGSVTTGVQPEGRPWSGKGITLPHGTVVRMEYNGKGHSGQIDNGEWLVEGARFNSPSAAAGGVARTRRGKPANLDGWVYWQAKRPGDTRWYSIQLLRNNLAAHR